jgi:hypothetical protein
METPRKRLSKYWCLVPVTPENIQGRDRLTMSQQSRTQFPSQQVRS